MIDNVILLITGTLHQRAISELVPKCHPLGSFEQMEAVNIAQTPAELYNAILVDTPLGRTKMNTWITFTFSFTNFVARGSHWVANLVIYCLDFFLSIHKSPKHILNNTKVLIPTSQLKTVSVCFSCFLSGLHLWAGFGWDEHWNNSQHPLQGQPCDGKYRDVNLKHSLGIFSWHNKYA